MQHNLSELEEHVDSTARAKPMAVVYPSVTHQEVILDVRVDAGKFSGCDPARFAIAQGLARLHPYMSTQLKSLETTPRLEQDTGTQLDIQREGRSSIDSAAVLQSSDSTMYGPSQRFCNWPERLRAEHPQRVAQWAASGPQSSALPVGGVAINRARGDRVQGGGSACIRR